MVRSNCKKEEFQHINQVGEQAVLVKFSKETVMEPVYEGEGDERRPTGETVDSGLVCYTEEMVYGGLTPEKVREIRLAELDGYDKSAEVNSFTYQGKEMWYDKVTRACIAYSMKTEKEAGAEETTLYDYDSEAYRLPIDLALAMFAQVELYAKECYNVTEGHKRALALLDDAEDILAYDITAGYPGKLKF